MYALAAYICPLNSAPVHHHMLTYARYLSCKYITKKDLLLWLPEGFKVLCFPPGIIAQVYKYKCMSFKRNMEETLKVLLQLTDI